MSKKQPASKRKSAKKAKLEPAAPASEHIEQAAEKQQQAAEARASRAADDRAVALAEAALVCTVGNDIKAVDCAAFSVLVFSEGYPEDEQWAALGAHAMSKFARFGWQVFHALGGLNTDWIKNQQRIMEAMRAIAKDKKPQPAAESSEKTK